MGFYRNGKFNLSVSLRYAPSDEEMNFLCQMFQQVSKILYDATDGQQSIGTIQIAPNSLGGDDADIWIHPNDDVWPNSTSARLWIAGQSMDVSQDFTFYPSILAHELSHYLYDLRDEYNNDTSCQNDITTQASIMEGYSWNVYTRWTDAGGNDYDTFVAFFADFIAGTALLKAGEPTEFCHEGNHNATANNNQNNLNDNMSCWEYMGDDANHGNLPYNLIVPAVPNLAAPNPNPPASVCVELISAQRYMLVLDRSGSMSGNKIEQLKSGAHFWVDYVHTGEELGLVKFSGTATLSAAMSEVPASAASQLTWRDGLHTIVDGITASGSTAIGDALRIGLTNLLAAGSAAAQVIILFTDGLQNSGVETAEQVLPDAVAAGVKIYTIGLGADQDVALLTSIADTTGGVYFGIPADIAEADAADAISDALAQVSGNSRSNSAIKSFQEVDGAYVDSLLVEDNANVPFAWIDKTLITKQPPTKPASKSFKFPVVITPGSTSCTLGVKWYNNALRYKIKVTDPTGVVLVAGPNARLVEGKFPHTFFDVKNPKAGKWEVEVIGVIRASKFRTIGFEVNKQIRFEANVLKNHIKAGETIKLQAKLMYGYALPGVKMQAVIRTPSGKIQKVDFYENVGNVGEKEEERTYTAAFRTKKSVQGQYTISVIALYKGKEVVYKPDELYSKRPGYNKRDIVVKTPEIYRSKTLCVQTDRLGDCQCDHKNPMIHGYNTRDLWIHPQQKELVKRWKDQHKGINSI